MELREQVAQEIFEATNRDRRLKWEDTFNPDFYLAVADAIDALYRQDALKKGKGMELTEKEINAVIGNVLATSGLNLTEEGSKAQLAKAIPIFEAKQAEAVRAERIEWVKALMGRGIMVVKPSDLANMERIGGTDG